MKKGKIVYAKDLKIEPSIEPPLSGQRAINSKTVESPMMTLGRVFIPPGGKNQRHYHIDSEAAGCILKGRLKVFFGPDHDMEEYIAEAGDFFYFPRGVIHGFMNMSSTETAEIIASHCGKTNLEEVRLETVFVEPTSK